MQHSSAYPSLPVNAASSIQTPNGLFILELEERLEMAAVVAATVKCLSDTQA